MSWNCPFYRFITSLMIKRVEGGMLRSSQREIVHFTSGYHQVEMIIKLTTVNPQCRTGEDYQWRFTMLTWSNIILFAEPDSFGQEFLTSKRFWCDRVLTRCRYEVIFIRREKQILDKIIIKHHLFVRRDSVLKEFEAPNELGLNLKSNLEQCGTSDFCKIMQENDGNVRECRECKRI